MNYCNSIPAGPFIPSGIRVPRYVCCGCGYAGKWLDPEDLPKLKKEYGRP